MLHWLCPRTSFLGLPQLCPRIGFKYIQFSNLENNPLWPPYYCVKKLSWTPSCEGNLSNHAVGSSTNTQCPTHCTTLHEWSQRTNGTSSSFMIPMLKSAFELYHILLLAHHPFPILQLMHYGMLFKSIRFKVLTWLKIWFRWWVKAIITKVYSVLNRPQKLQWGFEGFLRMQWHWASWGILG